MPGEKIDLFRSFPSTCIVIGLGGIGGHVAKCLSLIQSVKNIILFDNDMVEMSNLNRTIYDYASKDHHKVDETEDHLYNHGFEGKVIGYKMLFNGLTSDFLIEDNVFAEVVKESEKNGDDVIPVFDCRDNYFGDFIYFKILEDVFSIKFKIVRAAYDGYSITLDISPENNPVWGEQEGYSIIPSLPVPSEMSAYLIVYYLQLYLQDKNVEKSPLTTDIFRLTDLGLPSSWNEGGENEN